VNRVAHAVNAFVTRMLDVTVQLIGDVRQFPNVSGRGSGVLIPRATDFLLLTAGHLFKKGTTWSLETPIKANGGCLHVALRDLHVFAGVDLAAASATPIDLAWAWIRRDDIRAALRDPRVTKNRVDLRVYQGPSTYRPIPRNSLVSPHIAKQRSIQRRAL
jgi:hypothetical protein